MVSHWLLIDSGPCEPAFNMALDEVLMNSAIDIACPTLRFYGWTQPAASFGYFQRIRDVENSTLLRPLVRRPTGGGIVPHDADWTYSVTIPAGHEWYEQKATESYHRMHLWIREAFKSLGIATNLAEEARKPKPGECFAGYELDDVLWQGRKIAGAAQRRTRQGLLVQGSVQPPPLKLSRSVWQEAMTTVAKLNWESTSISSSWLTKAKALAARKYAVDAYTRRR